MTLGQKLFSQFKNQLGLGEGGRVPDGEAFRHFLKVVQGAFTQFIDVNLLQNGSGGFLGLIPDRRSAGRRLCILFRSRGGLFRGNLFRSRKSLGGGGLCVLSGGKGVVVEFFSHEKNVGEVFGFAGGAGAEALHSR